MQKPQKPLPTDCCGSGCMRCVYDIYVEELKRYRAYIKQRQSTKKSKPVGKLK